MNDFKYIYGPVSSWRLGVSLGIDLLSQMDKRCNFDCIYCQLGKGIRYMHKRRIFIPTSEVIEEVNRVPDIHIDYITFSGCGEPTLARNLGSIIKHIKKVRNEKVAVLTNSSLLFRKDVQTDLQMSDLVEVKVDAVSSNIFKRVNNPHPGITVKRVLKGIKDFRKTFTGRLSVQVMFVKENFEDAEKIVDFLKEIKPDEVHINTPLRPCGVEPLSRKTIESIIPFFKSFTYHSVYNGTHKRTTPISSKQTIVRRGKPN